VSIFQPRGQLFSHFPIPNILSYFTCLLHTHTRMYLYAVCALLCIGQNMNSSRCICIPAPRRTLSSHFPIPNIPSYFTCLLHTHTRMYLYALVCLRMCNLVHWTKYSEFLALYLYSNPESNAFQSLSSHFPVTFHSHTSYYPTGTVPGTVDF
jgi:hypothetical protein